MSPDHTQAFVHLFVFGGILGRFSKQNSVLYFNAEIVFEKEEKKSARSESGDSSCDLMWMEGNWWSIDVSGSMEFISMGKIPE